MKFNGTPEMDELEKQFIPYISPNGGFVPDTPESAKKAKEKFVELVNAEYDRLSKIYCE